MLKTVSSTINAIGALNYKGTWNASTNTPTLTSGVGVKGDYYVVSVAGSTNLDGVTLWGVGDWAVFNGSVWQKVDGGDTGQFVTLTVTSLTGYMYANNTSPITASLTIPAGSITGLGTMSTQNANAVAITGGNVTVSNVNVAYRGASSNTGAVNVGGNLSSSDIGIIASFVGNGATYSYVAVQNTNNSATSYSSISAINDGFTAYSDMGVNSSNYSYSAAGFPDNSVSSPNASFFVGYNGNVAIATWNANPIHFIANASASTSSAMVVNGNNSVTIQSLSQSTSSTATFATASLPLVPAGYLIVNLNGTNVKIPYYAV